MPSVNQYNTWYIPIVIDGHEAHFAVNVWFTVPLDVFDITLTEKFTNINITRMILDLTKEQQKSPQLMCNG